MKQWWGSRDKVPPSNICQWNPLSMDYKVWCLCDAKNGYTCNFEIYTGAGSGIVNHSGGLGHFVVLGLVEPFKGLGHCAS